VTKEDAYFEFIQQVYQLGDWKKVFYAGWDAALKYGTENIADYAYKEGYQAAIDAQEEQQELTTLRELIERRG